MLKKLSSFRLNISAKVYALIFLPLFFILLGSGLGYYFSQKINNKEEKSYSKEIQLVDEVYTKIKENYWEAFTDKELIEIFKNAHEQSTLSFETKKPNNKQDLLDLIEKKIRDQNAEERKKIVLTTINQVLASLKPPGRNKLMTKKEETALREIVQNINKERDLFKVLEVSPSADTKEIEEKAKKKLEKLQEEVKKDPKLKKKLEEAEYAYSVLTDEKKKTVYEKTGIEPTVIFKPLSPQVDYLKISRISPTSWNELLDTFKEKPQEEKPALIIDLRDNIGGAIDILQYFLGPFIGPGNLAYEFFHQGEYIPFKTKTGWLPGLVPYKRVVILVNSNMQSSAEVMAAALKKYNVGVLIGEKTKGWGTVETLLPLKTKIEKNESYTLLLVTNLTLNENNLPIEGNGVEPHIYITDPNWKTKLLEYYNDQELVREVEKLF